MVPQFGAAVNWSFRGAVVLAALAALNVSVVRGGSKDRTAGISQRSAATDLKQTPDDLPTSAGGSLAVKVDGRTYFNYVYGYAVTVPDGVVGKADELLAKDMHGCAIELGRDDRGNRFVMTVYSDFNAVDHKNAKEAADAFAEADEGEEITVLETTRANLGTIPAIRMRLAVSKNSDGAAEQLIKEIIAAVRSPGSKSDRLYVISLVTAESRYENDARLFDDLVHSWQTLPLPQE